MEDIKKTVEEKVIDGLMYMASHPKEVLITIGMGIWTICVYRAGCRKALASVMKKSGILIVCESRLPGGVNNGRNKS